VVTEPTTEVGGSGVKSIVDGVENYGEAGGTGHAMFVGEHASGVEDQESVGEVAGTENTYREKKLAKGSGESGEAGEEGFFFFGGDGAFADKKPEAGDGEETGDERIEKNFAIGVAGQLEKPEGGERAEDGSERVHEALEAEGAAIGAGGNVGSEKSFFGR